MISEAALLHRHELGTQRDPATLPWRLESARNVTAIRRGNTVFRRRRLITGSCRNYDRRRNGARILRARDHGGTHEQTTHPAHPDPPLAPGVLVEFRMVLVPMVATRSTLGHADDRAAIAAGGAARARSSGDSAGEARLIGKRS